MLASVMAAVVVALLISARPADEIMTHKGNTTIVNTPSWVRRCVASRAPLPC